MITIKKLVEYTIPMLGNKLSFPYGKLLVTNGEKEKICTIKYDSTGRSYITYHYKRYYLRNDGGLYNPRFSIDGKVTC